MLFTGVTFFLSRYVPYMIPGRKRSACTLPALLFLVWSMAFPGGLHAQQESSAGLFLGLSAPEKNVVWHGLADTTVRSSGFSIGAVYECGLSEHLSLVLMPQYSEVIHSSSFGYRNFGSTGTNRLDLITPPLYSLELPVSVRASLRAGSWRPYASAGVFLGYAFAAQARYIKSDWYIDDEPQLDQVRSEAVRRVYAGLQCGAGVTVEVARRVSLWGDWSLMQHLHDPIDSDMVTWEAPLRSLWRFGIAFSMEGGAR